MQETDVFEDETHPISLYDNKKNDVTFSQMPRPVCSKNSRRRSSLDVVCSSKPPLAPSFNRRSSIGAAFSHISRRRLSLGEDGYKLHLAWNSSTGSINSINEPAYRRLSIDSCSGVYDPRRRSSLGAESLIEYDLEEEENEQVGDHRTELPADAVLGLQYADDVFSVKRELEVKYHPRNCLHNQPQVRYSYLVLRSHIYCRFRNVIYLLLHSHVYRRFRNL